MSNEKKEGLNLYFLIIVCFINLMIGACFISETVDVGTIFAAIFLGIPFSIILNIVYLVFCIIRIKKNIVYIFFPIIAIFAFFSPIIINSIEGDGKYYKIAEKYMESNYPNKKYNILSYDRNRNEAGENYVDFEILFEDEKNTEFILFYDYDSNDFYDEVKNIELGYELLDDKWINKYFNENEYVAVLSKSDGGNGDLNIALRKNHVEENNIEKLTKDLYDIYNHYMESMPILNLMIYFIDENVSEKETKDYIINRYYTYDSNYDENNYKCFFKVYGSFSENHEYVKYEIVQGIQKIIKKDDEGINLELQVKNNIINVFKKYEIEYQKDEDSDVYLVKTDNSENIELILLELKNKIKETSENLKNAYVLSENTYSVSIAFTKNQHIYENYYDLHASYGDYNDERGVWIDTNPEYNAIMDVGNNYLISDDSFYEINKEFLKLYDENDFGNKYDFVDFSIYIYAKMEPGQNASVYDSYSIDGVNVITTEN